MALKICYCYVREQSGMSVISEGTTNIIGQSILSSLNGTEYLAFAISDIPADPFHNSDMVLVHFNHIYCMEICDKLMRDLAMLTYIYIDEDEC